jgi:hypothetical protein
MWFQGIFADAEELLGLLGRHEHQIAYDILELSFWSRDSVDSKGGPFQ